MKIGFLCLIMKVLLVIIRMELLITHYQRLLDYIIPDYVHVLSDGKIIKTGDKPLALDLEEKGYSWINDS